MLKILCQRDHNAFNNVINTAKKKKKEEVAPVKLCATFPKDNTQRMCLSIHIQQKIRYDVEFYSLLADNFESFKIVSNFMKSIAYIVYTLYSPDQ